MTPRSNSAALESIELMNGAVLRECKVLEIELEAAKQRIRRLEEAGDEMYKFINPPSPCMRSTRMDNLLQGWDDAKINTKEAKP
jgi:hypothetical protein